MEKLSFGDVEYEGIDLNKLSVPQNSLYYKKEDAKEIFRDGDSPLAFNDLDEDTKEKLLLWCMPLEKIKTFNNKRNSYGLKHTFEKSTGIYVSNGAFKGAMLLAGFKVKNIDELNWRFNISERYLKNEVMA